MLLRVIFLCFITGLATQKNYMKGRCKRVLDGDTIMIGDEKIRLFGIDAPELSQISTDHRRIGRDAKQYLEKLILNKEIKVHIKGVGIYKRKIGIVYLDGIDINKELLFKGHAVISNIDTYDTYHLAQKKAWLNKRGLFQTSSFMTPRFYRKLP